MDNIFIQFWNYNKKLTQIISNKLGMFLLFFALILSIQALNLNSFSVVALFIKVALETAIKLAIIFILLYPHNTFSGKTLEHLRQFVAQKYWRVFWCLILFFLIASIGMLLLILPGLLAFFFFQYSYLYVALDDNPLKEAFIKSTKLVMKILALNILIAVVYAIIIGFSIISNVVYVQSVFITFGTLYLAMLKAIVFLDNYKRI